MRAKIISDNHPLAKALSITQPAPAIHTSKSTVNNRRIIPPPSGVILTFMIRLNSLEVSTKKYALGKFKGLFARVVEKGDVVKPTH